eukprot:CAMPEP_0201575798 /NCGR_PEP_ID=MMETSP0190_2-20130828/21218_1 /ASSEMBLY_ACC=CAM_ASM_000263 /TAXON_ID=37353 /ORGANISM="Rosalina sp." /LENGTH=54 /DNA_ID=CAMNT_0048005877 /DNA_START=70 /DNA_END=234 /DNA_ORIENTATION=-
MRTVESDDDEIEDPKEIESTTNNETKEKEIDIQLGAKYLMQRNREMREIEVDFQ